MDIKTAAVVLLSQTDQLSLICGALNGIAIQIADLASQENSTTDIESRIKALLGPATIQLTAISSQQVLVQQAVDELAKLVN